MILFIMSKIDKKLASMKINPQGDWTIDDLKSLAQHFNITFRQPGTSHVTFTRSDKQLLTVPAHKPIKVVYVKRFVELIENIRQGDDS